MNDFSDLESKLKQLRPAAVSPGLATRVEAALRNDAGGTESARVIRHRRPRFQWNWLPLGLAVSAAAAFLLLARLNVDHSPKRPASVASSAPATATTASPRAQLAEATGAFVPAGLTQVVYSTRDEGLQFRGRTNSPVRRVRSHKRETVQWKNPDTGASLRVSYPSEEVTFTPVSGQ